MFDTLKKKEGRPSHAAPSPANDKADGPAIYPYPVTYPKGADHEIDDSMWGCYENYKTEYQGKDLDPNKEKKGR